MYTTVEVQDRCQHRALWHSPVLQVYVETSHKVISKNGDIEAVCVLSTSEVETQDLCTPNQCDIPVQYITEVY